MKLRGSKLQDNAILEEFYDKIIENYDYGENYYIILIHAVYDIPGKSSDGQEMFDASDEIYDHILCKDSSGQSFQSRPVLQRRNQQHRRPYP